MENKQQDSLPEFDSEYIDQLFSSGNPVKKKATPKAAEPEKPKPSAPKKPKPSVPKAPEKPKEPDVTTDPAPKTQPFNRVVILIAAACLLVGFFLGRLSLPNPEPGSPTQPSTGIATFPNSPDIAVDYASMSTQQLVSIAVQIPELVVYGSPTASVTLTRTIYWAIRSQNPVLAELEQRPDAITMLTDKASTSTLSSEIYSANTLVSYYTLLDNVPSTAADCQWKVAEDGYVTIYEYTEAPKISYISTGQNNYTIFEFGENNYMLTGNDLMSSNQGEPNFWFRIERQPDLISIPEGQSRPRLGIANLDGLSSTSGSWVKIQHYDKGWFVYGYAKKPVEVSFSFSSRIASISHQHDVVLTAFPDWESETTRVAANTVLECQQLIEDIELYNPDKDWTEYPMVAELLTREDGITQLLQLSDQRDTGLLRRFQPWMTNEELEAMQLIIDGAGYMDPIVLSRCPLAESDGAFYVTDMVNCYVSKPTGSPISLSYMNCWIYVPLTGGGQLLYQNAWKLEAKMGGSDLTVWKLYDNDTHKLIGWLASGTMPETEAIWLRLVEGNTLLEKQSITPVLLES